MKHAGEICEMLTTVMELAVAKLDEKPKVEGEHIVQEPVEVIVEKVVERVVEKPVEVIRYVEVEKIVEKEVPVIVEKIVEQATLITGRDILYRPPDVKRYLQQVVAVEAPSGRVPSNFCNISGDMYQFGSRRIQIMEQNGQIRVRVGGGFSDFLDFLYRFGAVEAKKMAAQVA